MININLIPPEYIEKEKHKAAAGIIFAAVALVGIVVAGFSTTLLLKLKSLETQKISLEAEVKKLEDVAREVDALEARKREIEAKTNTVQGLLSGRFVYPAVMEALAECLPPGQVSVKSLGLEKKEGNFQLAINAEGTSIQSVIQLLQRLEARPVFSNINLGPISYLADGVTFQINMDYKLQ